MTTTADKTSILKAHALAKYDEGYDIFVECWEYRDYAELLDDNHGDVEECKEVMAEIVELHGEQESNCRFGDEY